MRYWTMYEVGVQAQGNQSYYNSRRAGLSALYRLGGRPVKNHGSISKALQSEDTVVLVLVEPTDEDIAALGNALVVEGKPDSNTKIVVPPQNVSKIHAIRSSERYSHVYYGSIEPEYGISNFTVMKNGEPVDFICGKCNKILGRAGDGCEPPMIKCTNPLFNAKDKITLPPEELFMSVNRCTDREDFSAYTYGSIRVTASPEDPITADTVSAQRAHTGYTTRLFREIACTACVFHDGRCMVDHRKPGSCSYTCGGPYMAMDLPKPTVAQRRKLRYLDRHIPMDKALAAFGGTKPNIRADPELRVTQCSDNTMTISVTKMNSKARGIICWHISESKLKQFLLNQGWSVSKEPQKTASFFESLVTKAYYASCLSTQPSTGWGSQQGSLISFNAGISGNKLTSISLYYGKYNYLAHHGCSGLNSLMSSFGYPIMYSLFKHINRGSDLYHTLGTRKENKGAIPAVEEYMNRLIAADKSNQSFNHTSVLEEVVRHYAV